MLVGAASHGVSLGLGCTPDWTLNGLLGSHKHLCAREGTPEVSSLEQERPKTDEVLHLAGKAGSYERKGHGVS